MAVVPMQKIQLVAHADDVQEVLDCVQSFGALEFRAVEKENTPAPDIQFPHAQLLPRVQHAVQFLDPYTPKVGLWKKLRDGSQTEMSEMEVKKKMQETDVIVSVVSDLEKLQVEFADMTELVRRLTEQHELLTDWKDLSIPLEKLETSYTRTLLLSKVGTDSDSSVKTLVEKILLETNQSYQITELSDKAVALTLMKKESLSEIENLISSADLEVVLPPEGKELPEIELVAVAEKLAAAKGELALLHDQAEHFAITHNNTLRTAAEILTWQKDRFSVLGGAIATKYTVAFEGWIDQNKRSDIEAVLTNRGLAMSMTDIDPEEGEEPPVELKNSSLIQPFEAVTRLYGMPGHKDLDPTVFLAGFFFLFFGMSLTDVGYGFFLMLVSAMILILFKVSAPVRMFAKLLLFVGFSTMLVGLLFGGYLGIPSEHIPEFLKQIQLYDPIGNPLPVFYTALGLGVVQVMFGMILKIYSEYRQGRLIDGVLDQGPWLFVFVLGILYLGVETGYVTTLETTQVINLIYVGLVLIVVASGRKGDSVLEKVKNAALSLYDSIGYFSDILSYSRLLALGLATTALAFAVNLIAGMVSDVPYIGIILSTLILVIGHIFTLAVNTLGAFIHSARLQFVEFFGKFISGTGKQFTPLSRTQKYVTIKKE